MVNIKKIKINRVILLLFLLFSLLFLIYKLVAGKIAAFTPNQDALSVSAAPENEDDAYSFLTLTAVR